MPGFASRIMCLTYQHFGPGSDYAIPWGDNMVTPPLMNDGMFWCAGHALSKGMRSFMSKSTI